MILIFVSKSVKQNKSITSKKHIKDGISNIAFRPDFQPHEYLTRTGFEQVNKIKFAIGWPIAFSYIIYVALYCCKNYCRE